MYSEPVAMSISDTSFFRSFVGSAKLCRKDNFCQEREEGTHLSSYVFIFLAKAILLPCRSLDQSSYASLYSTALSSSTYVKHKTLL
jgi:hypothetical protein